MNWRPLGPMGPAGGRRAVSALVLALALVAALRPDGVRRSPRRPTLRAVRLRRGRHVDRRGPLVLGSVQCRRALLRWLGSGEVCSEYVSILCQPGCEEQVVEALAPRLSESIAAGASAWDLLELESVEVEDHVVAGLVRRLAGHGHVVHQRPGPTCLRVPLADTWEAYLATLSKGHRKQVHRVERGLLDTGRAVLHTVARPEELPAAIERLIDLHQRRRRRLGQPGCFASARFAAFHREVMPALLEDGCLELHWLQLDGRAVAAEYHLAGGGLVYAYQAGVEPDALDAEPGRLVMLMALRRAIGRGYRAMDFLRGDEPYKAAFPRPAAPDVYIPCCRQPAHRAAATQPLAGRRTSSYG